MVDRMIDRTKHIPLYIQLKEEIVKKIRKGVWDVDSQIPTEKALMEEYGLGRVTVREALSMLVNEGYLYKKHGIGTFVARKQPSLGFEPLISLSYSLKAKGISPKNLVMEKKIISPEKKLLAKMKWEKKKDCFYLKRIRFAESTAVAIEESYFSQEFEDIEIKYDFNDSIAKVIVEDLKLVIRKVEQVIISRIPTEEEQRILNISENTQVLHMERWIYSEDKDEPFYYLSFIIPENIYSFPIENL